MNNFSVIIPTIQKTPNVLYKLVQILAADLCVTEIIVINNKPEIGLNISVSDKVKIITPKQNLFVNFSWNLGVSKIQNENFALLNDDMLICPNFISRVAESEVYNDKNTGLIGAYYNDILVCNEAEFINYPKSYSNEPIFIPLSRYFTTGDWGIAILGKKSNYYPIPDDLKIIYGDNYLLYKNLQNGKNNYYVSGFPFKHIHSASSGAEEFSSIILEDIANHPKYFQTAENIVQEKVPDDEFVYKLHSKENGVYFLEINKNNKKDVVCLKKVDDVDLMFSRLTGMLPDIETKIVKKIIDEIYSV